MYLAFRMLHIKRLTLSDMMLKTLNNEDDLHLFHSIFICLLLMCLMTLWKVQHEFMWKVQHEFRWKMASNIDSVVHAFRVCKLPYSPSLNWDPISDRVKLREYSSLNAQIFTFDEVQEDMLDNNLSCPLLLLMNFEFSCICIYDTS